MRATWIGANLVAIMFGVALAMLVFPDAMAGRNPTGQFGWHLVGFSSVVSLPIAAVQSFLLAFTDLLAVRPRGRLFVMWFIATSIGVMLVPLPLWWVDVEVLIMLPHLFVVYIAGGILFLALLQYLVLRLLACGTAYWILATTLGAVLGGIVGSTVIYSAMLVFIWLFGGLAFLGGSDDSILLLIFDRPEFVWAVSTVTGMTVGQSALLPLRPNS